MRFVPIAITTLGVLFAVQLANRLWPSDLNPTEPAVGDLLPDVPVESVEAEPEESGLRNVLLETPGCDVVVLASAYCSHCRRYRLTWNRTYDAWIDSLGFSVPGAWVFVEESPIVIDFLGESQLRNVRPFALADNAGRSWTKLGVVATPMTYLVDDSGVILAGSLGPRLPAATDALESCSA